MTEEPLGTLFYLGKKNESVTVTVTPQNTTQLVEYTLNGSTNPFPSNGVLNFNLNNDGSTTTLQLVFDFNSPSGGSYIVGVRTVTNYPDGESVREWLQAGSAKLIKDYVFDTQ
jgi:hypothetical protein